MIKLYIKYILNLPLYYISFIFPKNKNIWVFGAWFGKQYSDNPKYLFEYVNNNDKDIRAIWITKDITILKLLKTKGYEVYMANSLKAIYFLLKAEVKIFCQSMNSDLHCFANSPSDVSVQLWHGTPLKKIGCDDKKPKKGFIQQIKQIVFPMINEKYDLFTTSSSKQNEIFKKAFCLNKAHFSTTGYPRCDMLVSKKVEKIILYMPTLRGKKDEEVDFFSSDKFDIKFLDKQLFNIGYKLILKLHPANKPLKSSVDEISESNNIRFYNNNFDIYEMLSKTSILITDYSSIYFDFLLTKRPIIFTPFDIEEYQANDREFYYNYDEVTPGPKCKNWNNVMEWINKFDKNSNLFYKEREEVNKIFNQYDDFKNCERVYKMIKEKCNV